MPEATPTHVIEALLTLAVLQPRSDGDGRRGASTLGACCPGSAHRLRGGWASGVGCGGAAACPLRMEHGNASLVDDLCWGHGDGLLGSVEGTTESIAGPLKGVDVPLNSWTGRPRVGRSRTRVRFCRGLHLRRCREPTHAGPGLLE
jgi:hypothetical protein